MAIQCIYDLRQLKYKKKMARLQTRLQERNEAIYAEFRQLAKEGGSKTAIYEHIGKKYEMTSFAVFQLVRRKALKEATKQN